MRPREVRGDDLPLGLPAGMGLIAQVRFDIAPGGNLPERLPQQLPLARQGGIVEVQIQYIGGDRMLIDPLARRQQDLPDEGSASCFAAVAREMCSRAASVRCVGRRVPAGICAERINPA